MEDQQLIHALVFRGDASPDAIFEQHYARFQPVQALQHLGRVTAP